MASYYFTAEEAAVELRRRRDAGVGQMVEERWNDIGWGKPSLPNINGSLPAFMCRHVATFRYEDAVFVRMAERAGLEPVWLEYLDDKFVDKSPVKMSYVRPGALVIGRGRNGGLQTQRYSVKLANSGQWNGRRIREIRGEDERPIIEWHHEHLERMYPGAVYADFSEFLRNGQNASGYYEVYLELFIAHGVLFEDYHGGESSASDNLGGFTRRVFEPAWNSVVERYGEGLRPIIVPMPWQPEFAYYPGDEQWRDHGILPADLL